MQTDNKRIYPQNFEQKIGFTEIRQWLAAKCLSPLGKQLVEAMTFSDDIEQIKEMLGQTREMRLIVNSDEDFPLDNFIDMTLPLKRVRMEHTFLEEEELFALKRSLTTILSIVKFLHRGEPILHDGEPTGEVRYTYPELQLVADGIATFPNLIQQIDQILDKFGKIRDNASPELQRIRRELAQTAGSISRTLNSILREAQEEGVVEKDVTPTLRDGRLVIPVAPGLKRKINGIVQGESASGRTVFIEPAVVVEANNKVRELEADERREIIRILTQFTNKVRPHVREMLDSYDFLGRVDFIHARAVMAQEMNAVEPEVLDSPHIDWIRARHPLLERSLRMRQSDDRPDVPKAIVPLDIMLTPKARILIISGPNAGGKSVCLKTTGLLQYMLQCGLSLPVDGRSKTGLFSNIMIDIGDEQSLENDLSTYSSHLVNMKNMIRYSTGRTLLLIDEFGTGTEPQIGGAIAESVLEQFCRHEAWAVITTHYQNLKHFADSHDEVVNGAMLYDRHEMRPLFQLAIGRPGSSFAIEIARKIGLPEEVIRRASDIVGSDYIQSDKYLQDIVRDKRYWEQKRTAIHEREKDLEKTMSRYEEGLREVEQQRKDILAKARAQAGEMLAESNRRIENAIREIRENQAAKEETKLIRASLKTFEDSLKEEHPKASEADIEKKIEQIKQRRQRHEKRKADKARQSEQPAVVKPKETAPVKLGVGSSVRIKGLESVGTIESTDGKMATVVFGDMRTKLRVSRLEPASLPKKTEEKPKTRAEQLAEGLQGGQMSRMTRDTMDSHRREFHQDLDVRGMRGDEALAAVQYFLDDAILVGMPRVRILHGKGNGILRELIRQYLATVPNVTHFADEQVQLGGAGITVVDL